MNALLLPPSLIPHLAPLRGRLQGFDTQGHAQVLLPGEDTPARADSLCLLRHEDIGAELLLLPATEASARPVILGRLHARALTDTNDAPAVAAVVDGRHIRLEATEQIELECGEARLSLHADGRIQIRGGYILNHASGINRIRGAAVKIN